MGELLTGLCPNCGSKLTYKANDSTVMCFACDSSIEVSEFSKESKNNFGSAMGSFAAFMGFDNPDSGVVFLENFFETYDWDTYQHTPELLIPEITEVIGNNKVKNGSIPETWYLDFMGLYVPVFKKFEALDMFSNEIREKFNPFDNTDALSAFDQYRSIATTLLREKESILKSLSVAIGFAERFALDGAKLSEMKSGITVLRNVYKIIATKQITNRDGYPVTVVIDSIETHPAYESAKKDFAERNRKKYLASGINADSVYSSAIAAYNAGKKVEALSLFESIREYSDSAIYIKEINQYFSFFGEMYRFAGKHFIYKREVFNADTLDVNNASKKKNNAGDVIAEVYATDLSLYEVVNGVPAKEPIVKGIAQVIECYGSKIFYFKAGKGIACCDIIKKTETIIDKGLPEQYRDARGKYFDVCVADHAPIFAVKKLYKEEEKTGCLKSPKKPDVEKLNPYTIVTIDMEKCTATTLVPEMLDAKIADGDKIFYTLAYKEKTSKSVAGGCLATKKEEKICTRLMVCDIAQGTVTKVLDEDCEIHEVYENRIVYTLWVPNDYNEDLHVYNIDTGEDILIEKNIREFACIINDMLYYTIGNAEFEPLVRNNFEGTQREQVMLNIKKIERVRAGWFYVTKGYGYNKALVKIRIDGKVRIPICTAIKDIVLFEGNYIYYTDAFNCLRVVRVDGKENRIIAEKVSTVFPAKDGLYYCREEKVGDRESALSLYMMDRNGMNIRKIVFNVDKVQNDDIDNSIYYSKAENVRFKVYKPGKESKALYQFFKLTKFYKFKKASAFEGASDPELILTLGLPKQEVATGCFAKFKKNFIFEEAPIIHSYKNRGMSDREIMEKEEEESINTPSAFTPPQWMNNYLPKVNTPNLSTKSIPKANVFYTIFGFISMYLALFLMITNLNAYYYYEYVGAGTLIPLVLVSIFAALAGLGIFKRSKLQLKNKLPAILYVLSAIMNLIALIVFWS